MKKILAMIMCVAMILSLGVVFASADPGWYQISEDDYVPVGEMKITWDPEVSEKIELDGDMQDWADAKYNMFNITAENMVSWVDAARGEDATATSMPTNWNIRAYFVADKDYLYVGFYTIDEDVCITPDATKYEGDAFQFSMDFDNVIGKAIEEDPNSYDATTQQCIFYSFSPTSTDPAPIVFHVQNCDGDDYNGNFTSGVDTEDLLGYTSVNENGWQAEFAISWARMYESTTYKTYTEGVNIYVGEDDNLDLSCALYYLNRDHNEDGTVTGVTWAAGTLKGQEAGADIEVTWGPFDNGMMLYLPWDADLEFTCEAINVLEAGETAPEETEAAKVEETEAPANDTEAPADSQADAADTAAESANAADSGASTDASTEEGGCGSVVGFGAAAVLLSAMAAAVVLKKKD